MKRECLLIRCLTAHGVFGYWYLDGRFFSSSVERHWDDNLPNVSCVPAGVYDLIPFVSHKFEMTTRALRGETVGVQRSEGLQRYGCILHPANLAEELQGCIALGKRVGALGDTQAVLSSGRTVKAFLAALGDDPARLEIVWGTNPERV